MEGLCLQAVVDVGLFWRQARTSPLPSELSVTYASWPSLKSSFFHGMKKAVKAHEAAELRHGIRDFVRDLIDDKMADSPVYSPPAFDTVVPRTWSLVISSDYDVISASSCIWLPQRK